MLSLIVLASCYSKVLDVQPPPGPVPVNPVLYVFGAQQALRIEDATGAPMQFTRTPLSQYLQTVAMRAPEGTELYVILEPHKRLGPWRVAATTIDRSAPTLELESVFRPAQFGYGPPPSWTLSANRSPAVWELSVKLPSGRFKRGYQTGLELMEDCAFSVPFKGPVQVAARGRFADGSLGEWTNTLELEVPGPTAGEGLQFVLVQAADGVVRALMWVGSSMVRFALFASAFLALLSYAVVGGIKSLRRRK